MTLCHIVSNSGQTQSRIYLSICLYLSLTKTERENSATFDDFANHKVVFLGDEAHHNNTQTKKQIELFASWENTVQKSFTKNKHNYLIELTATAGLDKKDIAEKYKHKMIFDYNLSICLIIKRWA